MLQVFLFSFLTWVRNQVYYIRIVTGCIQTQYFLSTKSPLLASRNLLMHLCSGCQHLIIHVCLVIFCYEQEFVIISILSNSNLLMLFPTQTRMHSSRMRTARLLPVSPSMHCSWGCTCQGCTCPGGGVPVQVLPPVNRCKNITFANFVCGR